MKKILTTMLVILLLVSSNIFAARNNFEDFEKEITSLDSKKQQKLFENYLNKSSGDKSNIYPYLGYMYYNGIGIQKNVEMGVNIYQRAADDGSRLGYYLLGKHLVESGQDVKGGLSYLLKASDASLVEATLFIAKMYDEGIGLDKDQYYALEYYHRAAKLGSGKGKFVIAQKLIASGEPTNYKKGLTYLIDSADVNYEEACDTLQKLFITPNKIVERNAKKHARYLICSADNGNIESIKQIAEYYSKGIIVMIDNKKSYQYYKQYVELFPKPKSQEDFEAYYKAGISFIKFQKYRESIDVLKVASKGNIADASKALGRLYESNYLGNPNYENAVTFYKIAQSQGLDTTEEILRAQKNMK